MPPLSSTSRQIAPLAPPPSRRRLESLVRREVNSRLGARRRAVVAATPRCCLSRSDAPVGPARRRSRRRRPVASRRPRAAATPRVAGPRAVGDKRSGRWRRSAAPLVVGRRRGGRLASRRAMTAHAAGLPVRVGVVGDERLGRRRPQPSNASDAAARSPRRRRRHAVAPRCRRVAVRRRIHRGRLERPQAHGGRRLLARVRAANEYRAIDSRLRGKALVPHTGGCAARQTACLGAGGSRSAAARLEPGR